MPEIRFDVIVSEIMADTVANWNSIILLRFCALVSSVVFKLHGQRLYEKPTFFNIRLYFTGHMFF